MRKIVTFAVAILALVSCVVNPPEYTPPSKDEVDASSYTIVLNEPFDEAWAALVNHAASSFFSIDQIDKDSGLMTLNFGSDAPSRFIDCGVWTVPQSFTQPYADYLRRTTGATLSGKMNILVGEIDDQTSQVRVSARYVFSSPPDVWSFDTGGMDTEYVSNPAYGTDSARKCKPTYEAENSVLTAISG